MQAHIKEVALKHKKVSHENLVANEINNIKSSRATLETERMLNKHKQLGINIDYTQVMFMNLGTS